ncbi:unnamed protein product [Nesidiocoris tenuis]|uniref:Uncharacterized protein n=1 Tax=Nesidiocoris tenuis TaxID=355587 RepID=A0A6H5GV33_9HEMI|nr:unnamed protein product [Nesidiocoris tenuis]
MVLPVPVLWSYQYQSCGPTSSSPMVLTVPALWSYQYLSYGTYGMVRWSVIFP